MTELVLIRHGETDWNAEQRIQGHLDIPLNHAGRAQAAAIGARFCQQHVDVLVSSDLRRALQTAQPIADARNIEVIPDARLRERHLGVLQGKTREEAQRDAARAFDVFRSRAAHAVLEQGETLAAFADRVISALTELTRLHHGKRIVAVTHGGVLDIAYRHASGMPLEAARNFALPNAAVNTLRVHAGQFQLVEWSDVSHLPDASAMDET